LVTGLWRCFANATCQFAPLSDVKMNVSPRCEQNFHDSVQYFDILRMRSGQRRDLPLPTDYSTHKQ
jgi:hypothetical protein